MPFKKREIIDLLRKEILSLKLKPGTIISETSLSDRFQLSRTPIRDILKQLSLMGYIDIYPKKGSIVSYIDLESVEQITYLRSAVEKEILKELSPNISLKGLHELKNLLTMQKDCIQREDNKEDKMEEFMILDDAFHKTLFNLAGRSFLWDLIQQFNVHYIRYRRLHALKKEKLAQLQKEHEEILNCVVRGDIDKIDHLVYQHIRSDINSSYFLENFIEYIKR